MRRNVVAHFHAYDTVAIAKRDTRSSTTGLPKTSVVIGIILGLIALITCTIIALLLLRLARQNRKERRQDRQVDLLEEARFSTIGLDNTVERESSETQYVEKPLPRLPSGISVYGPEARNGRNSASVSRYSVHAPTSEMSIIRPPSPIISHQQTLAPSTSVHVNSSFTGSSRVLSHSRNPTASSHSRSNSNPFGTDSSVDSDILHGKFTIVNVTEADIVRLQRPQLVYGGPPEYASRVRGRDPPFPSKMDRKALPPYIVSPGDFNVESGDRDAPSSTTTFPAEKQRPLDVPSTPDPPSPGPSYTVHLPPSSSTSRSSLVPPRNRLPLTITASRPVSNLVVENMRTILRPNGTQGKGRLVTMSVLVEDSESSNSDIDALENRRVSRRESQASSDVLGQVLEGYTSREGDLPPYTPRDERIR